MYSTIISLDGYITDKDGNFDWAAPEEEVHAFVNDLERRVGAYLYGRRMYEVMRYWETARAVTDRPPVEQDFAQIWRAAVQSLCLYSSNLWPVGAPGLLTWHHTFLGVTTSKEETDEHLSYRDSSGH
jgi:hypothetical protein